MAIDAVLAVGGGSVIDSAKAICFGTNYDGDVYDMYIDMKKRPATGLPLYTVLTLSATGSEVNSGSVLSNSELHSKLPCYFANPAITAIDPSV